MLVSHVNAKAVLFLAAALGLSGVLACSADGSDDLLTRGGRNGAGGEPGEPGAGSPGAGGGPGFGADAAPPLTAAQKARGAFDALLPELNAKCGTCHVTGVGGGPKFLEGPDAYASIKKLAGIVVKDWQNSKLLLTGATTGHSGGPGVDGKLKDDCTAWLKLEANLLIIQGLPSTDPFTLAMGPNSIDLAKAATGVDGAKMTFTAAVVGTTLSLTQMKLVAPATTGIQVTSPVFVMVDGAKETMDPVDSFSNLDQSVPAGQTVTMGPGTALLAGYAPTFKMKVSFRALKASMVGGVDGGATGGGCKSVATFTSSAAGPLTTQCRGCHGGNNAGATGAMNLTALGTDNAAACAQALTKVTLAAKATSAIIVRPRAGSGHPAVTGFVQASHDAAMLGWINNE